MDAAIDTAHPRFHGCPAEARELPYDAGFETLAGFIKLFEDQLNPQKSRVLLQLCLARGLERAAIQDAFYRY